MRALYPNRFLPYFLILPVFSILILFLYYPQVQVFIMSLYRSAFFGMRSVYVGFDNYLRLFSSSDYHHSLWITLIFTVIVIPSVMAISIALAMLVNRKLRGISVYRSLLIWSYALSPAAAGGILLFLFNPIAGLVNYLLEVLFGIAPDWTGDREMAFLMVTWATVWKQLGFNIVFYLAALQNVPSELLDSASVDGAGAWQRFKNVTFPMLGPIHLFLVVMNLIYVSFESFPIIDVMTRGGPIDATKVLMVKLYEDGFRFSKLGLASAESIVLFLVVVVATFLLFRSWERRIYYEV